MFQSSSTAVRMVDWYTRMILYPTIGSIAFSGCLVGNNYFLASHMPVRSNTCILTFLIILGQIVLRLVSLITIYVIQFNPYSVMVDSNEYSNEKFRTLDQLMMKMFFVMCTTSGNGDGKTK